MLNSTYMVALWGFIAAAALGALSSKTRFCVMGAISDWIMMGDKGRLRAWFFAIAVALIGTQLLQIAGYIDLRRAPYVSADFGWLGHVLGGALFGIGMTLAGGCSLRGLVRVGTGCLKSLVVILVLAISAAATLYGVLAAARAQLLQATNIDLTVIGAPDQTLPTVLASWLGVPYVPVHALVIAASVIGLLLFVFKDGAFRRERDNLWGGIGVGACVVAGWWITGALGAGAPESFNFAAPVAHALLYLMLGAGARIDFGIAAVLGVIAGSFVYAAYTRQLRVEWFSDRSDMINHLLGAALMGVGGVLALGCTIGQGVTGISTLALGAVLTLMAIILGSVLSLKMQYYLLDRQGVRHALRATLKDLRLLPRPKAGLN